MTIEEEEFYIFEIDDLNFIGYDTHQLEILCEHHVLRRTRFPKLVIVLLEHPIFQEWVKKNSIHNLREIINLLIYAIRRFVFNFQGNLIHTTIDLKDDSFWKMLVDACFQKGQQGQIPPEEHEEIIRSKSKTLKKKERSFWI